MKKRIFTTFFTLLLVSFAASLMVHSADIPAQPQQRVLQQRKALMVIKPTVTSVTPQKAILPQGGDPVVVEAKGANLNIINSAKAMRAGSAVAGIEVILDKSQLPTALKLSLKASGTTPIATDYQLAVFDAGNNKLLDVPPTVLAIEVIAPIQKSVVAQKTTTAIKTTQSVQRQTQTKQMTSTAKPGVASVTPQKAVLTQGGDAVTIEAKGTYLTAVGSVKVTQSGAEAQGIEEALDKSRLPTSLKVSLTASSQAPVAKNYQLSVYDASSKKIMDIPTTVLAIEVVAPDPKALAVTTTRTRQQQAVMQREQTAITRHDGADLGISGIRVPSPLQEGKMQTIEVAWQNFGGAASDNKQYLVVLWYRSQNEDQWKPMNSKLCSGQLAPGQQVKDTFSLEASRSLPGGEYSFRGEVDTNKVLQDLNRANNTAEKTFSVQHMPITIKELDPIYAYPGQWTHLKINTLKNMTYAHNQGSLKFLINGQDAEIKYVEDLNYENWDICAVVPQGATTGSVILSCNGLDIRAREDLHIVGPVTISDFFPREAGAGDMITIRGTNFVPYRLPSDQIVTGVYYQNDGGQSSQAITSENFSSDREIKFKVPPDARSGILTVNTLVEGKSSEAKTTVPLKVLPKINYVVPWGFNEGREIQIVGFNMQTATAVEFNGTKTPIGQIRLSGETVTLFVRVPKGATTGKVKVTNSDGSSGFSDKDFRVVRYVIHSLSPSSGPEGTMVTITGEDLDFHDTRAYLDRADGTTATRMQMPFVGTPTRTSAQVRIPAGLNYFGKAYIYVNYAGESNWADFTITEK
jgi:hypothetical protein